MKLDDVKKAILTVGDGRGFVIAKDYRRPVITAGHCLPSLPPSHPASDTWETTYPEIISPLGVKPSISAECIFVDPIADLAVLDEPDGQERYLCEQADAYPDLVDEIVPLKIAKATEG